MDKETRDEVEDLLHIASWCAGKLYVSLIRGEVSSRAEFEALAGARDRLAAIRCKLRGIPNE